MRVANGDHAGASGIVLAWPSFGAGDKKGLVCTLCGLAWGGLRRTGLPSPGVLSADNPHPLVDSFRRDAPHDGFVEAALATDVDL